MAMTMQTITVFVVVVVAGLSSTARGGRWDNPCHVQPAGSELTDAGGEVNVPEQCVEGSVWWNYPKGILQVQFHNDHPFIVCLTPDLGPLLHSIAQLADGGQMLVRSPLEGETVCLPQAGRTVVAMLEQPSFQTYMTLYNYTLRFTD